MELRHYLLILKRRWWVPALLLLLVAALTPFTYHPPAPVYQASVRFTIGVSSDRSVTGVDPILTAYQASEYIRDDFVEVLHSEMFAADVNANLKGTNLTIDKNAIAGSVEKQHRIMSMAITWGDEKQAGVIASAAAKALETQNAKYFKQLGSEGASVAIIDGPDVGLVPPSLRERLDIPIRLGLALAAGLLLAFLLDYLDDTVRDAPELEAMGMKVLGEIPASKRGGR
jgi:capsular polysaccharide biosynthesis protein